MRIYATQPLSRRQRHPASAVRLQLKGEASSRRVPVRTGDARSGRARRRDLRRFLDPLLNTLVEEGRITRPEGWNQRAFVEMRAVNQIRSLEVDDDGVHGQQQDAFDKEEVIRVDGADRLDRVLEHRPQVVLVEDAGWDRQRMGFVEDVVARDPGVVFEARGHRLPGYIEVLLPVG